MKIPFNYPFIVGKELYYIAQAVQGGNLSGDGPFTKKCCQWLEKEFSAQKALLVHSGTAALEMAAILCGIKLGDEIIMPSYTFVSTANAFVLRGGKPVFVDIRPDTLNINEDLIEEAITSRTKVICPVHYAGVGCNMDKIMDIAERHNLLVVEDAAQGVCSTYKNKALGTIGHMGCLSFHETKNIISGEGGALLINAPEFIERAEIIREKGTNRSKFFRGEVDKYTWVDIGSSYLASELTAAFLFAQLEEADSITSQRNGIWDYYKENLQPLEENGFLRLPFIPEDCEHNAHMFYVIMKDLDHRTRLINYLKEKKIYSVFHYVPLHSSPFAVELGHTKELPVTDNLSARILRLPCYFELTEVNQRKIVDALINFFLG